MGIRFSCHSCATPLNIKAELAGRRGVCPQCKTRFRIPESDTEYSTPLEDEQGGGSARPTSANQPVLSADGQSGEAHDATEQAAVATQEAPKHEPSVVSTPDAPSETESANSGGGRRIPELLSDGEGATWYVRPPGGGQYGPATNEVLLEWISQDRVAKNSLLWRDGWPQWREASEALPEIADSLPGNAGSQAVDVFQNAGAGPVGNSRITTPMTKEKTSPIPIEVSNEGGASQGFAGDSKIGTVRRQRASRRIVLVGVLAAVVIGLIATLIFVTNSGG